MFKFEFSLEETNKILGALGKMPYEMSADVIASIREQAAPQLEAQKDAPTEEEKPKK